MNQDLSSLRKHYLFVSDFDQTLSFNDSGAVLSELIGARNFEEKVAGLARINFIQQGGELAYLLLHDPEYRRVRREHLVEVGKQVRLKRNIQQLAQVLQGLGGYRFSFYVASAAPAEIVKSALEGIIPAENIFGTRFRWNEETGEIETVLRMVAGYGKVAVVEELQQELRIPRNQVVYVGDGSSDIHVMLDVNRRDGLTIAVSESKYLAQIAKRTVLSDDAMAVVVPIGEEVLGWDSIKIHALFETCGYTIREWDKGRTDWLSFEKTVETPELAV